MDNLAPAPAVAVSPVLSRARLLTIVWLVSSIASIVLLPMVGLAREPSTDLRISGMVGVTAFFASTAAVMWSSVTPWTSPRVHLRTQTAFAASAVASVPLVAPVSAGTWSTWAWLGAATVGVAPIVWRWQAVIGVAGASAATSVLTAVLLGGSVRDHLIITLGIGAALAAVNWAPVWLWELLVRAEMAQSSTAALATSQERLRFAQDVHDILGHDLTVIALKAELASRTAHDDPERAARESAEVRSLAETALERVRATASGQREVDLAAELGRIADLLQLAGVECALDADGVSVPAFAAGALATVVKEATTNVLRHSSARSCRIVLDQLADGTTLTVTNDGVGPRRAASTSGSGVVGMGARLAPLGGTIETRHDGETYTVRAWVPHRP